MKTVIKLNWLRITNFKGIKSLMVNFNDQTFIYGANEAGKTTLSDAWHWLLTGKDSLDREKFNIKNTVDTSLNRSNHEVEAGITVNGDKVTLKRILKENWVKPKAQPVAEYKGNVQEYFFNDVPIQAGEYQSKISGFLDESYLKMLTNPAYFNRLKWQDQRAVLVEMAGTISDGDVLDKIATLHNKAAIMNLTNILNSGKTFADYKKQISASKKLKKEALDKIPSRIDEVTRNLPEAVDYDAYQAQINEKLNAIADIDILINDETAAFNQLNKANNERQQKIHGLQFEVNSAENIIRSSHQKTANDQQLKINEAKNKVISITANINSKQLLVNSTQTRINTITEEKSGWLVKWHQENDRVLTYDDHAFTCPTCKRGLEPGDIEAQKQTLLLNFNEEQTKKKAAISEKGKGITIEITEATAFIETINTQLVALRSELAQAEAEVDAVNQPANATISIDQLIANDVNIMSLKKQIEALKAESIEIKPVDLTEKNAEKSIIQREINELQKAIAGKDQREKMNTRIVELRAEESELSQQIADLEGVEFSIAEFDKAKITETERRVNVLFGNGVTFKMYDYTVEGNPVDTCQAMRNGVPYNDLNTAGKVQAGLTIINALNKFYEVQAPIFLDNRESTSEIPSTDCQVINLVVSPGDSQLRVA
jgi:exonuclease SbcC